MKHSTRRDIQADKRKNQLLDISLTLFAQRGVENVSIKDLATEARVSQGLIYHYFQSKDELLATVVQHNAPLPEFEVIIEQLETMPAREGLLFLAESLANLMPKKRLILRLLIREILSTRPNLLIQVISFREKVMERLAKYFQNSIDKGELRPHQPLKSKHILISSFFAFLLLDQPIEPAVPQIVEIILDGITAKE